ncbi:MAG: hypothetical protein ACYDIC_10835 [Desulfobaccales bacterium]
MTRLLPLVLGFLLLVGHAAGALAASQKAMALRQANGLEAFTPAAKFLAGNFVAEEMNPAFIYGPVKTFIASLKCPTAWLVEADQKTRLSGAGDAAQPAEFTVYLEEDCPDKVVYYVFIDQSNLTPQQWIEWREKFHKSKTEPEFGSTKSKLDKACTAGCGVGAELRFIQKNGELVNQSPEKVLQDLKVAPIYDLNRQQKMGK